MLRSAFPFALLVLGAFPGVLRSEDPAELPPAAAKKVDFEADIRPILTTHCLKCHGPEKQESGYRLDVKRTALTGGDAYAPNILPGKGAESPLVRFVAGVDPDVKMPPKGPALPREQAALLRAWIDQGAVWPDAASTVVSDKRDWWSLKPLAAHAIPKTPRPVANPIDAFIRAKLAEKGLSPSPPADRRTLIRRLTYDLTGLPPTPAEVAAFVSDPDPLAYDRLVERLLASPRYGERWARHWLDTVHFAETHGHDQDRIRENAWPYRDYVIRAFNADLPYARFVADQVAGDVLSPGNPQATAALGFLAAGPWDESTLRDIREDTLDRQIGRYLDRDDILATVMNNFVGLTVQCARCHDHKFDPVPQRDYYALQAVFAGVERANRAYDPDPAVQRRRVELAGRKKRAEASDEAAKVYLLSAAAQQAAAAWEQSLSGQPTAWQIASPKEWKSSDGSTLTRQEDGSLLASGTRPERDTYTITIDLPAGTWSAVRLEVLTHDSLSLKGPGRQDNGNLHLSEVEIHRGAADGPLVKIAQTAADWNQEGWDIAKAIDGNQATAWGIYPQVGKAHEAVFAFAEKVAADNVVADKQSTLTVVLKQLHGGGHLIGRPRLAITASAHPLTATSPPPDVVAALKVAAAERTPDQRVAIARHVEREAVARELNLLPKPSLVYAAAADFEPDGSLRPPPGPRPVHLLTRGDIRKPKEEIAPGMLTCVALPAAVELPAGHAESARRAALAQWLVAKENPLTWRVAVNRVWHHHFGRGLVATPNDFGHMGSLPTHPELLDWLALWFREGGGSVKALHRLIVTSDTYRQRSVPFVMLAGQVIAPREDGAAAKDADNTLLWRMHRTRLDAECVRDAVLAATHRLDLRMGGPSDRQFGMKPGRHVTPIVNYAEFDLDSAAGRRRSVYRFLFRTLPDPFMEALDCPAGDQLAPVRANSVTVQQALAMWNDAFMLRQCEHLASELAAGETDLAHQIDRLYRTTLARAPTAEERQLLTAYATQHGLANACRLVLNSNEFLFVE